MTKEERIAMGDALAEQIMAGEAEVSLQEIAEQRKWEQGNFLVLLKKQEVSVEVALQMLSNLCRIAANTWWQDIKTGEPLKRNKSEFLMLIVSELAEVMEGVRKSLPSDKLPGFTSEEEEMADTLIRCFDYCGGYGLRIGEAFVAKLHYNLHRADHKVENRLALDGKKF